MRKGLFDKIMGKTLGKSAMTTRFGEQEQSSPPQQPFFFFLGSEGDFLQQFFWHLSACLTSFLQTCFLPLQAYKLDVGSNPKARIIAQGNSMAVKYLI